MYHIWARSASGLVGPVCPPPLIFVTWSIFQVTILGLSGGSKPVVAKVSTPADAFVADGSSSRVFFEVSRKRCVLKVDNRGIILGKLARIVEISALLAGFRDVLHGVLHVYSLRRRMVACDISLSV